MPALRRVRRRRHPGRARRGGTWCAGPLPGRCGSRRSRCRCRTRPRCHPRRRRPGHPGLPGGGLCAQTQQRSGVAVVQRCGRSRQLTSVEHVGGDLRQQRLVHGDPLRAVRAIDRRTNRSRPEGRGERRRALRARGWAAAQAVPDDRSGGDPRYRGEVLTQVQACRWSLTGSPHQQLCAQAVWVIDCVCLMSMEP